MKHFLALADGSVFPGHSAAARVDAPGETVFNTGMTGYQEMASDPSYAGQILALTLPEAGNYGCCRAAMESRGLFLGGLVVTNLNPPSGHLAEESFAGLLTRHGIPCLSGVDTRALVFKLRQHGTLRAWIHASDDPMSPEEAIEKARAWPGLSGQDYATRVSTATPYAWNDSGDYHIALYDFGVKQNILRQLAAQRLRVTVLPARTPVADALALRPRGIFLSNGPADPRALPFAIEAARKLSRRLPLMGICLGHQILGLAHGAECGRLPFGHHGCNHPVKDHTAGTVEITSQNHTFSLLAETFPAELEITHTNLNDLTVEGFRHRELPCFGVQFHPEAAPGPHDSHHLFTRFRRMLEGAR